MSDFQTVCLAADVGEGQAKIVLVGDRRLAVFHVQGNFHVLDDECPHAGASLALGVIEGQAVRCRIHHWRFRLCDGGSLDHPGRQWNVRTYPVRLVDGQVQAQIERGGQAE